MCHNTTYPSHYSTECSTGGSGQCDGYCIEHGNECACSCHTDSSLPLTVEAVRDWHDEFEDIVASFDFNEGDENSTSQAQLDAIAEADRLRVANPGKQFAVINGQDRMVVAERYL